MLGPILALLLMCSAVLAADEPATYESTRKLPELHHAVGISLPFDWADPKDLPLGKDRGLECRTCHGLKDMEKRRYDRVDTNAPDFLRGGPYPRLEEFCFRCHGREEFARPNVHAMLDDRGQLKEDHCTYCHEAVQKDRDRPLKPAEYRLRLPPEKLCYGCHYKTPHFNAMEHQLAKPKESMRRHMRESERSHGIVLPLSAEGKLMCPTCHTPHQYGVIDPARNPAGTQASRHNPEDRIAYVEHPWAKVIATDKQDRLAELGRRTGETFNLEYRRIDREVLLRLPAKDGTLCLACHEFEQ
jgi:hypothetical protein